MIRRNDPDLSGMSATQQTPSLQRQRSMFFNGLLSDSIRKYSNVCNPIKCFSILTQPFDKLRKG